jgi:hypothetical protein
LCGLRTAPHCSRLPVHGSAMTITLTKETR